MMIARHDFSTQINNLQLGWDAWNCNSFRFIKFMNEWWSTSICLENFPFHIIQWRILIHIKWVTWGLKVETNSKSEKMLLLLLLLERAWREENRTGSKREERERMEGERERNRGKGKRGRREGEGKRKRTAISTHISISLSHLVQGFFNFFFIEERERKKGKKEKREGKRKGKRVFYFKKNSPVHFSISSPLPPPLLLLVWKAWSFL